MATYKNIDDLLEIIDDWQKTLLPIEAPEDKVVFTVLENVNDYIHDLDTAEVVEVVQTLWKKTANEKPDSTRHLIVANGSLISHYGYYLKPKDKWYRTYECEEEISEPAYWMDMPDPPKESIYGECDVMDGRKVE